MVCLQTSANPDVAADIWHCCQAGGPTKTSAQPDEITTEADTTQRDLHPSVSAQFSEGVRNSQHPPPNMLLVPGGTKGKGKTARGPNLKEHSNLFTNREV